MSDYLKVPIIKNGETVHVLLVDKSLTVAGLLRLVEQVAPGAAVRAVKESA